MVKPCQRALCSSAMPRRFYSIAGQMIACSGHVVQCAVGSHHLCHLQMLSGHVARLESRLSARPGGASPLCAAPPGEGALFGRRRAPWTGSGCQRLSQSRACLEGTSPLDAEVTASSQWASHHHLRAQDSIKPHSCAPVCRMDRCRLVTQVEPRPAAFHQNGGTWHCSARGRRCDLAMPIAIALRLCTSCNGGHAYRGLQEGVGSSIASPMPL